MKGITICCAVLALCLAASVAAGATAIIMEAAQVHKSAKEVIETLPMGAKVTTGRVNGEWVAISYQKAGEETVRQGWVKRSTLEEIPNGYDSRVSPHCILHAQDPRNAERFDLQLTEDLYNAVARSLINARGEPPFKPNVRLRIYLLSGQTFKEHAKRYGQPADSVAFSPGPGLVYLDYSLRSTTPPMKGLVVHELATLVLREYAVQPRNRRGAGAPLPIWLIELFATYHEYQAGFNTDNLIYVSDKPKLSTLVNKRSVPTKEKSRREYLATAGTLGHMLLNYGGTEQFTGLVRTLQATAGRGKPDAIMLQYYEMTRTRFQTEWARYVDQLKEKYGIRKLEKELKEREGEDDKYDDFTHRRINDSLANLLTKGLDPVAKRLLVNRIVPALFEKP